MKQFLIYMDILGYEERAKKRAEITGDLPKDIRQGEIIKIEGRLNELKASKVITKFNPIQNSHEDAWLAFTDAKNGIFDAFKTVREVLKANLPLAIAIGVGEFDDSYLIQRSGDTIEYLKTGIIPIYEKFYKDTHKEPIKQTFVLLTPEAHQHLDSAGIYSEPYPSAGYYLANQKEFEKRLRVLEFLEKIGSQRTEYWEIEELYVKPTIYHKIKGTLEKNNIVFIIGDAEMGKSYTAINVLYEYSKEGYEPIYIPEERRQEQWATIRHETVFDGKAIYLEDPWGKVEFEKGAESLFRDIGTFITEVRRKDCKVIITSREKVFEEFEKRKETAEDLWEYASQLKVNLAYSKENLIEMLRNYIDVFEPAWGENEVLKKIALDAVGEKLKTPMSIKKLMDHSRDVGTENDLKAEIEKAAENTKIAFAREIKEMFEKNKYDKLVFQSLAYIGVKPKAAEVCYEEVLSDLGYSPIKTKTFNELMEEFREVEIQYECLSYIHPSYEDAFGFALTDNDKPNNICKNIFSSVLFKLSEKDEAAEYVAEAVTVSFDRLSEDVRNKLLLKLTEAYEAARFVARAVAKNFDRLPEDVRNKLLLKLTEKDEAAEYVAEAVVESFDTFPFGNLPEDVENFLFKFSEKGEVAKIVAGAVLDNFDRLPEDVRNKLLLKLFEKDEAAEYVAEAVAESFDTFPEDVKNLLDKLQGQLRSLIKDTLKWNKISAIRLISNVRTKIDKGFALRILDGLSEDEDKKVRAEAEALKSTHPFISS